MKLLYAIGQEDFEKVDSLIAAGADVNEKEDGSQKTPLMFAANSGQQKIAELLISKGADVKDSEGETPLDLAIDPENNQVEIADLLRKHGGKTGTQSSTRS